MCESQVRLDLNLVTVKNADEYLSSFLDALNMKGKMVFRSHNFLTNFKFRQSSFLNFFDAKFVCIDSCF